jgi:hypothetical protein
MCTLNTDSTALEPCDKSHLFGNYRDYTLRICLREIPDIFPKKVPVTTTLWGYYIANNTPVWRPMCSFAPELKEFMDFELDNHTELECPSPCFGCFIVSYTSTYRRSLELRERIIQLVSLPTEKENYDDFGLN